MLMKSLQSNEKTQKNVSFRKHLNVPLHQNSSVQNLHLLFILGQHVDILLFLLVLLLHYGPLILVQGDVLPLK